MVMLMEEIVSSIPVQSLNTPSYTIVKYNIDKDDNFTYHIDGLCAKEDIENLLDLIKNVVQEAIKKIEYGTLILSIGLLLEIHYEYINNILIEHGFDKCKDIESIFYIYKKTIPRIYSY